MLQNTLIIFTEPAAHIRFISKCPLFFSMIPGMFDYLRQHGGLEMKESASLHLPASGGSIIDSFLNSLKRLKTTCSKGETLTEVKAS